MTAQILKQPNVFDASPPLPLPSLPESRPLLLIGHGSRDAQGRQNVLDFAAAYQALDASRPVIPCFFRIDRANHSRRGRSLCRSGLH